MKLVGLGGSLREQSYSRATLAEALRLAAERGMLTELLDVRALNLPMFMPEEPVEAYLEQHQMSIDHFLNTCRSADAMIWCSPTYHGTVSGAMKNAIDFVELMKNDSPPYLTGRAIGLVTINGSTPWSALRDSVHELRAWLSPTSLSLTKADFTVDMKLGNERAGKRLARIVDELYQFAHMQRD